MNFKTLTLLAVVSISVGACATVERTWHGLVGGQNPLVGKIWNVREKRFISQRELVSEVDEQDFIILGEKHDSRDHHELQAEMIRALAHSGTVPKVAFEQLSPEQGEKLAAYLDLQPQSAAGIGDAVGWRQTGWPDYKIYEPVFQAALDAKTSIVALNLKADEKKRVDAQGLEGIDDHMFRDLELQRGLPQGVNAMLAEEIRAAHCYKLPDSAVPRFVSMQRARDAVMAHRAFAAKPKEKGGVVIITGAGHARNEWGIPVYLKRLDKKASVATIAFVEVKPEFIKPEVYAETEHPYDYIWFTPSADRVDPCEKHKDQLKHLEKEDDGEAKAEDESAKTPAAKKSPAKKKKR